MSSGANSAGDAIAGDEDLLIDVFSRLPAKSLVRLKSVSRKWLFLISSPHFVVLHARRNSNPGGIFIRRLTDEFDFVPLDSSPSLAPPFRSLDFVEDPSGIKILHSCKGLLLCSSRRKIGPTRNYYVYNPATHKFLLLPAVIDDERAFVLGVCLAFEPSKSSLYKVIIIHNSVESAYFYHIRVYSSETGSWKQWGSPFVVPYFFSFDDGVFCNGVVHWFSHRGDFLCFDVDNERLEVMPAFPIRGLVEHMNVEENSRSLFPRGFRCFCESSGHVHLIGVFQANLITVCELEMDCSEWVVKYQIDLDTLLVAYPEMVRDVDAILRDYLFIVLLLVRKENEEDSSLLLHIPRKIISYNLRKGTFKELFEFTPDNSGTHRRGVLQCGRFDSYEYFESLASV